MSAWRRYEILLPLKFNNGDPIPRQLIVDTLLELEERYGAVSCETQIIHGLWRHQAGDSATISCALLLMLRIFRCTGNFFESTRRS